jgi:DNA-binding CsgD family transcriptional regulator
MSGALDLTQRERQVMELLAEGLTTKQIAWRLRIAPATARRHIGSAAGQLGAIRPALGGGRVPPDGGARLAAD